MSLLEVRNVTLRFGGVTALNDVSFDVEEGELFAIIGPNGAGKTSIFNCLNAVYHPTSGSVAIDGVDITHMKPSKTAQLGVARTFQNLALFNNLTVIDNLMLGRHVRMKTGFLAAMAWWGPARNAEIEHRLRCEEIADFLGLTPYRDLPVGILPYGVQKKIELGRALAMEPRLLLLDEPVAGMNLEETEQLTEAIVEVNAALGIAIVLVEHDMHLVMDIADRVFALDFGVPIASGTPEAVRNDPKVIEAYLGAEGEPTGAEAEAGATEVVE